MPKSKSKATARAARRRGATSAGVSTALAFYSGGTSPFRLADKYKAPTGAMVLVGDAALQTTSASGAAAQCFNSPLASAVAYNTVTGTNLGASWTISAHPKTSTLTNVATKSRCLAMRVTVRYIGPESTCAGVMYVGGGWNFTTQMVSSGLAAWTGGLRPYTMRPGKEWVFYAPQLGDPDFEDVSTSTAYSNYISGLVFLFTGLPAATAGLVTFRTEHVVEFSPDPAAGPAITSEAQPHDLVAEDVVGVLNSTASEQTASWVAETARAVGRTLYNQGSNAAVLAAQHFLIEAQRNHLPMLEL